MSISFIHYFSDLLLSRKAPCKRKQQCWPTTSNIVGCYMLRPFAHPVACCCVFGSCCAKFEIGQTVSCEQTDATTSNTVGQQCWEVLGLFARSLKFVSIVRSKPATIPPRPLARFASKQFYTVYSKI